MIAGPQILSAIFIATSENWRRNSAAFVVGAALSVTLLVSLAYFLGIGANRQRGSNTTLSAIVLVLLLVAMVHVYLTRAESEPPKWMGKLTTAQPTLLVPARVSPARILPDRHPHLVRCRVVSLRTRRASD